MRCCCDRRQAEVEKEAAATEQRYTAFGLAPHAGLLAREAMAMHARRR